ncbi:hypothetical protein [Lederbergia lenta]|uniref:hypothetical protein n=1 Tax=Lederbergia lenta TaxID=1467 RepID=UPI00204141B2|nr:hypothetical protein [Lederbergia lenta]MCM3110042.1 hypothetical protein [Lederbergia lenta]
MAVEMRERPLVSGEDALRFLQRVKRNNEALRRSSLEHRIELNKERCEHESRQNHEYVRA